LAADSIHQPFEKKYGGYHGLGDLGNMFQDIGKMLKDGTQDTSKFMPMASETMNELVDGAALQMAQNISPMQTTWEFTLAGDGGNLSLKKGNEFAKRGVMDMAKKWWDKTLKDEPDNAAAHHNIGVFYEVQKDPDSLQKAEDLYIKATELSDNTLYIDAFGQSSRCHQKSG
jgi:hypothetical protein